MYKQVFKRDEQHFHILPKFLLFKKERGRGKMAEGEGQDGGRAGSPNHLSPPNYLENLPIILKIYEFGLRIKERPAGMLQ